MATWQMARALLVAALLATAEAMVGSRPTMMTARKAVGPTATAQATVPTSTAITELLLC